MPVFQRDGVNHKIYIDYDLYFVTEYYKFYRSSIRV